MTSPARRIAVVSTVLPYAGVPHAGGNYLLALNRAWDLHGLDYAYLVPAYPSNEAAATVDGTPRHLVLGARETRFGRTLRRVTDWWRRLDPGAPDLEFAWAILRDPTARRLISEADVIDVQWMEAIRLQPLLRRLNRRALLVGTFHDVLSQRFARAADSATPGRSRIKWWAATRLALRSEKRLASRVDACVYFADKDAELMGTPAGSRIIEPPMASPDAPPHVPAHPVRVVFVAYLARPENLDALRWMAHAIWPTVVTAHPAATLRVIGKGPTEDLRSQFASTPGVEVVGYVDDLTSEYAAAAACIVPLRLGAGVKFKVIEAMAAGVPVISTSTGAEGIGTAERFVAVSDNASELAAALIETLADPVTSSRRAESTRAWALERFGFEHFVDAVAEVYGPIQAGAHRATMPDVDAGAPPDQE
ncbi:MAG: hypothetical protein JWN68_2670 [Nocardioides sp.]|jgi:glycosyltransferase involved in cell wall biosynthesis|uniref:glycosyltransferase n=1 Tax=Nocardioides sp. TaxID=35761 RepID=UPI002634A5E1|nr:glycosyltransferase [Nocardioides sp.]MCW2834717.1 hypothetical protein [Nocardioides sp.]